MTVAIQKKTETSPSEVGRDAHSHSGYEIRFREQMQHFGLAR
jgi:hypothetical protein